jgi:predicted regulator of Ras-like GTPase activity (Roadblock/LC7/MglB family)
VCLPADGPLLCVAGESETADVIGALVGNIWKQYTSDVEGNLKTKNIGTMIIDCENGKLSIAEISRFLVCLHAPADIGMGLLKLKTEQLIEHLAPLHSVYKS